jgi:ABC-type lipoprotein export system ATPase subunit
VTAPVVEVAGLRFRYPGGPLLLAVDEFCVAEPGLVAVMGESGAGKSTFGALVGGQEQSPYEGSIRVFGQEWSAVVEDGRDADRQLHRRRIGYIPQGYGLLPDYTPWDMLLLDLGDADVPAAERAGRAERALEAMGLAGMADRLIAELSGGQQQRVAIARMLARDVGLVVADEPTANLDVATTRDVLDALRQAGRQIPVIVITHDQWVADQCGWRLDLPSLATAGEDARPETHGVRRVVDLWSPAAGRLETWHVDRDGGLVASGQRSELPEGALAASVSAGCPAEGDGRLLVADFDGRLWTRAWQGRDWGPWERLPFDGTARSVATSSAGPGRLARWVVQDDGQLWHADAGPDGWSEWERMEAPGRITSVAAAPRADGGTELLVSDTHGCAWSRRGGAAGWSGWAGLPVDGVRAVALSAVDPGSPEGWVVRSDGGLQHSRSGPDGGWSAWQPMSAPEGLRIVSVAAGPGPDRGQVLAAVTADGALLHRREEGGGWSDWVRS